MLSLLVRAPNSELSTDTLVRKVVKLVIAIQDKNYRVMILLLTATLNLNRETESMRKA
jgi:hypothetical protein